MKHLIAAILSFAVCFTSCKDETLPEPQTQPGDRVTVRFSVSAEKMQTRTNENGIVDLNLFLIDNLTQQCTHIYTPRTSVQLSCHPGKYTLYVITNARADLGGLTVEQIRQYRVEYDTSPDYLIMTARKELVLEKSDKTVNLPPVEVKRFAARINYNISVDTGLPIEIRSVQLMHTPKQATPFDEAAPSQFIDAPIWENTGTGRSVSGTFYMLPNCQGTVAGIENQKQKNPENAPRDATYLRIRAMRGTRVIDYIVFLGENNTDNFDIRPNTAHTLNIFIRNDDETDVRIRSYTVAVTSKTNAPTQDSICLAVGRIFIDIRLSGDYQNMAVNGKLEIKAGNLKYFNFSGRGNKPVHALPKLGAASSFGSVYEPPVFSRENAILHFTVSIFDRFGWVADFDFTYTYAHAVKVYTQWFNGGRGEGKITSSDAFKSKETMTLSSTFFTFYCPTEGCTLTATPHANRRFDGWYTGPNDTGLLSFANTYRFVPSATETVIYASFR